MAITLRSRKELQVITELEKKHTVGETESEEQCSTDKNELSVERE